MKIRYFLCITFLCIIGRVNAQTNNVGIGTLNPDNSALLDLTSTSKGLLVPRVSLTGTTDATTISNPAESLFIYNNATTGDVVPGFYYWNTSQWVKISGGSDLPNEITTITAVNPVSPLTGRKIGTYKNENGDTVDLQETVTRLSGSGGGKYEYIDENGVTISLDIFSDIINNPDFITTVTSIIKNGGETVTTITPVVTSGNAIATYKNEDGADQDIKETQTTLVYDNVNKKLIYNGEGTTPTEILASDLVGDSETKYTAGTGLNLSALNEFSARINEPIWNASLLQGTAIDSSVPAINQVLTFNGTFWTPTTLTDNNTMYTALSPGIILTGTEFSVPNTMAQWNANLLQGIEIDTATPLTGQVLKFNGTKWLPQADNNTEYTALAPGINLSGTVFSVPYDFAQWNASHLQGISIDVLTPLTDQVLKYDGTNWTPQTLIDNNTTYTALSPGITLTGTEFSVPYDFAQWNASKLLGNPLSAAAPGIDQVLKFDGTNWYPATLVDNNTTYIAGANVDITGNVISATDTKYTADETTINLAGTVFSVPNTMTLWNANKLQNIPLSTTAPALAQALVFNGTNWAPTTLTDNNTTYTNGTGLDLTGTIFSAQNTNPIWNASQLQTKPISTAVPTDGQALVYNSIAGVWEPQQQQNAMYSADETTLTISGANQFSALNDTAQWNASQLQTTPVNTTPPSVNQALVYNGTSWTPT